MSSKAERYIARDEIASASEGQLQTLASMLANEWINDFPSGNVDAFHATFSDLAELVPHIKDLTMSLMGYDPNHPILK